jgi:hypothetical protein
LVSVSKAGFFVSVIILSDPEVMSVCPHFVKKKYTKSRLPERPPSQRKIAISAKQIYRISPNLS